jgi:hypothetical protein
MVIVDERMPSSAHPDEEVAVLYHGPGALARGRKNDKPGAKYEKRALNMEIRVISFATVRKRAAPRLRSFKDELLPLFLGGIRPNKPLGLVTSRDLHLAAGNR